MSSTVGSSSVWAGRTLALLGIVLLAVNLRTGVAVLAPIVRSISEDVPLSSVGIGLLGMLPPLAFAASGFVAPLLARRIGLEATIVLACAAMVAGPIIRAVAPDYAVLLLGSVVLLAGMGFGNILLPPVIKRYFPTRIGTMTSVYATLMAVGASLPPLVAAPLAQASSWRVALGVWAIAALIAAVPWMLLWRDRRRETRAELAGDALATPEPQVVGRMMYSRIAWAIALAFMLTSFNVYAIFAWLPEIVADLTGAPATAAGSLLALFAITGLPFAILMPLLATRVRNTGVLVGAGTTLFIVGYLGMLLAPGVATGLWVVLLGSGPLIFPLTLALINLRTRSHASSVALSGFVQGIGYGGAALGPLAVGLIHDVTHGWTIPLIFLLGTMLLTIGPALELASPRTVEEDLARRVS
ncbi:MAG: MFS transporter [Rhodoglobus sp.]